MKEGWKLSKFQDLFLDPKKAIISGPFGSNLKSSEYQSEGVPLVRLQNVDRWNFINKNIIYITAQKAKNLSNHAYKAGDILITKLGAPLGKACIAPEESGEGVILADIVRVRLDDGFLNKDFVLHQLNSEGVSNQLKGLTTGATRPRVTLKNMREVNLVVPPLSEQEAIVAILDKAFTAIDQAKANIEQNIANAKELFQSKLNQIFSQKGEGWVEATLKDLCSKITDGVHKKPNYTDSGVPFIKINNLTGSNTISFENVSYISEKDHIEFCKRTKPERNDLLITKDGTIGIVRLVDTDIEFSLFVSVALIKPLEKSISPYLKYVLESPLIQKQINPQGAALKHLYLRDLRAFTIPIPPIEEQREIVSLLDSLYSTNIRVLHNYQTKLDSLDELKKSILQKAFAGELT